MSLLILKAIYNVAAFDIKRLINVYTIYYVAAFDIKRLINV